MHVLLSAYLLSALTCGVIGVASWRRRTATPAAGALAVVMGGLTWWSVVDALSLLAVSEEERVVLLLLIYPGVGAVVAGFTCLCLALADRGWRPSRRLLLLVVEPTIMSVAAATNSWHELIAESLPAETGQLAFQPLFWLHAAYSYALLAWALLRVRRERRAAPVLQGRQLTTLLVAACFPLAGNVATMLGVAGRTELTALFFVGTGLLAAHTVFRQGLLGVVPAARARVLERLEAAVIVLDEQDRLGDLNAAATELVARALPAGRPGIGAPGAEALGGLAGVLLGGPGEHGVRLVDGTADLDVRVTPLEDRRGRAIGRVLVVSDVTRATAQRTALREANAALQEQLLVNDRLRAEVAEQALRDPLTGLHNRRHLTRVLRELVARSHATGEPVSLVLLDVDHFKAVNDAHGHAVGDRLLRAMGDRLRSTVRAGDTVARYGGEEFVVLLPGIGEEQALELAESVRHRCGGELLPGLAPTLSAGVATTGPGAWTPEALLEQADRALYRAKAQGRNRLVGATAQGVGA